jgi:hypothetical protein
VRAYDPAYAYEMAVIILDGMRKLYEEGETAIYYLMAENENYVHPAMPEGAEEGIVRGMYKLKTREVEVAKRPREPFGQRGDPAACAELAQELLAEKYKIASNVWSVTSYTELRRDAHRCERWNMLHPDQPPRRSYVEEQFAGEKGPFIAASDYVRALPEQITRWVPGDFCTPWGPTAWDGAKPAKPCGGTSKSTPSASPRRRCTASAGTACLKLRSRPARFRNWASIRTKSIRILRRSDSLRDMGKR